ncbi:uncharacterized protein [Chelonus insularis]|uniref:uncharacterized protein n=1 Tax=Chelonus insularis TaxID=460826 RepID=UPI001588AC13|nr:uncharacterized protein LOC118066470 [Chelonus insularis]
MIPTSVKFAVVVATLIISVECVPKYDMGGFVPSSVDYTDKSKTRDQMAVPSQAQPHFRNTNESVSSRTSESTISASDRSQEARFGYSGVTGAGSGYGISSYAPTKMDLGGLVLGAVIGVGTILIIPKLLYIISGSYGAYARSDDGGFVNSMTKLDDILARHGIDTTTCMQRAVCTYAQKASESIRSANDINDEEKVSSFDRMIESITTNQVFRTAMRGTAIQEAVEAGRKGQSCMRMYRQCGFSMESIVGLLSNVLSTVTNADALPTAPAAPL